MNRRNFIAFAFLISLSHAAIGNDLSKARSVSKNWAAEVENQWKVVEIDQAGSARSYVVSRKLPTSTKSGVCFFLKFAIVGEREQGSPGSLAEHLQEGDLSYYYASRKNKNKTCSAIPDAKFFELARSRQEPIDFRLLREVGNIESGLLGSATSPADIDFDPEDVSVCFGKDSLADIDVIFVDPNHVVGDSLKTWIRAVCDISTDVWILDIMSHKSEDRGIAYEVSIFRNLVEGPP